MSKVKEKEQKIAHHHLMRAKEGCWVIALTRPIEREEMTSLRSIFWYKLPVIMAYFGSNVSKCDAVCELRDDNECKSQCLH